MKKKKTRLPYLPAPLFVGSMAVFLELLLYLWTPRDPVWTELVQVAVFGIGLGSVLAFLTALFKGKGGKICAIILSLLLTVVYMTEYFLYDAYLCFMTVATVLEGAGGVATDFASVMLSLIVRNLWRIGLVLLPTVLYALLFVNRKGRWEKRSKKAFLALLCAVAVYAGGFGLVKVLGNDWDKLGSAYHFDSAVRSFGLHMGLALDTLHAEGGEDADFVIPEPDTEKPTQTPTETPETEQTEAPTEPPVVYEPQVLDLNFDLLAEYEEKSSIASVHRYVASLEPSMENEFTGLFAGKNLILITAEAFSAEAIDPVLTPTLYRLANEGIRFTDYYQPAWGGSTSTGEASNLMGIVPTNGIATIKESTEQDLFLSIGKQLQAQGYFSAAYHNHSYTYYDRHKTHVSYGYDTFTGLGNGMEAGVKGVWPESDLELMDFTVSQYVDKQPFSVYYMTVSGHCLYSRGGNSMSKKNYEKVAHLDCSETLKCYYASQLELEFGMASLMRQLEEAGIEDDTVIVMATDHYPYGLEKSSTWGNTQDYLAELYGAPYDNVIQRDHSALIIWSGSIEGQGITVTDPVYSLDILPTLSNLFDVPYDSRLLVGRDVFSDTEPLALWPNYAWKTDKGTYVNGKFTPAEGVEVEEGYVESISSQVKNKITYSKSVIEKNYFNYVAKALGR